jgi:bla regulator protein blaR1
VTWLLDTLVVTGALILAVLVLRRPVAKWFGPGAAYALWALPVLRLILPPLTLPAITASDAIPAISPIADYVATNAPLASGTPSLPVTELAIGVWLAGVLIFLGWRAVGYVAMRRRLLKQARPVGSSGGVRLIESPAARGPVAFGVFDKVIALPPGFMDQPDRTARDLALAHEFEHHAGCDLAINLAMQPLFALHWFNPLAWLGWRTLRRDQEAACDARVLAGRDPVTRADYGRLIANFATAPRQQLATPLACPMFSEKPIIHRLRSLTMTQPTLRRRLLGRALFASAALALPLTATISYAASDAPPAPTAPATPHAEHRVTIIHAPDGATIDDASLHTRTVVRDGKTIVIKTKEPLSDAEADRRVDEALASMPEMPEPPMAPDATGASMPPMPPMPPEPPRQVVMIRSEASGSSDGSVAAPRLITMRHGGPSATSCTDGKDVAAVSTDSNDAGHREMIRMRWCGHADNAAHVAAALESLKQARERMAADSKLTPEMRERVLKQLDAEIARLSKDG